MSKDEFFIRIQEVNPTLYFNRSDYVNLHSAMTATCPEHGEFLLQAKTFTKKSEKCKCPECNRQLRINNFITKALKLHNNKYIYSKVAEEYVNNDIPVTIICPIHGEFLQRPGDHIKKWGCSKCSKKHKPTTQEWISSMMDKFGDKFDFSKVEYIDNKTAVTIKCNKHNVYFLATPANFVTQDISCPECVKEHKLNLYTKSLQEFIDQANKIHENKYDYSKSVYTNNKTKMCIICPEHGEFLLSPGVHLSGCGCPKCVNKNLLRLYNKLCEVFPTEELLYEVNVPWLGRLRFDMYFPKYNIAIEYDGQQHFAPLEMFGGEEAFKKIKERDSLKRKKCMLNNCTLFALKFNYTLKDFQHLCDSIKKVMQNFAD